MGGIHVLHTITIAHPTSFVKCKVSNVVAVLVVEKGAIHDNVIAACDFPIVINAISIKAVGKQIGAILLLILGHEFLATQTSTKQRRHVDALVLGLEASAVFIDDIAKRVLVLLMAHLERTNISILAKLNLVSGHDRHELQVIAQPVAVALLDEVNQVNHQIVVVGIIHGQRLVAVHGILVAADAPARVAGTNQGRQAQHVVAVVVADENMFNTSKIVADTGRAAFAAVKKGLIAASIAPVAIQCLAEDRNVETIAHIPPAWWVFIQCQATNIPELVNV